jgi:hypothetical protein
VFDPSGQSIYSVQSQQPQSTISKGQTAGLKAILKDGQPRTAHPMMCSSCWSLSSGGTIVDVASGALVCGQCTASKLTTGGGAGGVVLGNGVAGGALERAAASVEAGGLKTTGEKFAEAQKITVDDGTWDALTPFVVLDAEGATAGADGGIHLDEGWRWTPEGEVGRESGQIAGVEKGDIVERGGGGGGGGGGGATAVPRSNKSHEKKKSQAAEMMVMNQGNAGEKHVEGWGEEKVRNGFSSLEGGEVDGVPSLEGGAASCAFLEELGFDSASAKEAFDVAVTLPNPEP